MKFFLASRLTRAGRVRRQLGSEMNEFWRQNVKNFFFFVTEAPAKDARVFIQGTLTEGEGSILLTSSL
jgi:hypothetical protein